MEVDSTSEVGAISPAKKARQRSVAYPSYSLESCVLFTTKVDNEFTSVVYTPSNDISKNFGTSGGNFLMQLSSCVQYGLLDLKSGEGYKPTPIFEKIKKPLETENVNDTLLECLQMPPLYKKLINDFKDKQLPSEKGLANMLDRNYSVKGNAAIVAAKVFLKNLSSLGLITDGNVLNIGSYISFINADEEIENNNNFQPSQKQQHSIIMQTSERNLIEASKFLQQTRDIPVFLQGENREAKLILPIDFTEDDLKRIVKVLNAYLP